MSDGQKNIAIGFVVTVALALVVWALVFLHPRFGDQGFIFHARFQNVEKIGTSTRVTYAGRPVGEVRKITPVARSFNNNTPLYTYDVTIAIDSQVTLYPEDEITLSTSGLMGERYVAILPKKVTKGAKPLKQGGIMYADEPPSMIDIMQDFSKLAKYTSEITERLAERKNLDAFIDAINNMSAITKALNSPEKLEEIIDDMHQIVDTVAKGKGSFGKLVQSDALYNNIDHLIETINSYGLLFHLNKTWQRDKRRKAQETRSLLDSLQTVLQSVEDEKLKEKLSGVINQLNDLVENN